MTDWGPLMSEDADWWAVPGHVPPARMLRQLLDEGMLDGLLDDADIEYGQPCGHGDDCDCSGWVVPWRRVLLRWARDIRHAWVSPYDEDLTVESGLWFECDADHPGAEPATVWTW